MYVCVEEEGSGTVCVGGRGEWYGVCVWGEGGVVRYMCVWGRGSSMVYVCVGGGE